MQIKNIIIDKKNWINLRTDIKNPRIDFTNPGIGTHINKLNYYSNYNHWQQYCGYKPPTLNIYK